MDSLLFCCLVTSVFLQWIEIASHSLAYELHGAIGYDLTLVRSFICFGDHVVDVTDVLDHLGDCFVLLIEFDKMGEGDAFVPSSSLEQRSIFLGNLLKLLTDPFPRLGEQLERLVVEPGDIHSEYGVGHPMRYLQSILDELL